MAPQLSLDHLLSIRAHLRDGDGAAQVSVRQRVFESSVDTSSRSFEAHTHGAL